MALSIILGWTGVCLVLMRSRSSGNRCRLHRHSRHHHLHHLHHHLHPVIVVGIAMVVIIILALLNGSVVSCSY